MRVRDRGLRLVVRGTHAGIRVRGELLDLLGDDPPGDPHALARHARTTLAVAGTARAGTRVVQQVLGTLGTALGRLDRPLQRGDATLRGAHALVGLQQRLVDAAGASGARCSTSGRAAPAGRRRGPERCGSRPAARTAASNDPSNGRFAALVEGQIPSR